MTYTPSRGVPIEKKRTKAQRGMYGRGARGKATELHAKIVRSAGRCRNCGDTRNIQCAHIVSRRYASVRTDETNAVALCARCHAHFTLWADEWLDFLDRTIGRAEYERLKTKAQAKSKVDWESELSRLQAVFKSLEEVA